MAELWIFVLEEFLRVIIWELSDEMIYKHKVFRKKQL